MIFNPFNKQINDIEYDDLVELIDNGISEGWCLEFKQQMMSNKSIAKSISSFANSEGGWYIVGIKENDDKSYEIVGLDLNKYKNPVNQLNNAIKDWISPKPLFECKLIKCPDSSKVVLIVHVFKGHDVPYFSKEGKIFYRIGESSNPDSLKDKFLFEKLMDRKRNFNKYFDNFAKNDFDDNAKYEFPFFECFIYLDTHKFFDDFYSESFFNSINDNFNTKVEVIGDVNDETKFIESSIDFHNSYASLNSYILRHLNNSQKSINVGTSIELFEKGSLKLVLPIYNLSKEEISRYNNFDDFLNLLSDEEFENLIIIDVASFLWTFLTILKQYLRLLKKYDFEEDMYIRFEFKNLGRTVPFLDDDKYISFIEENNLPINLKSSIKFPLTDRFVIINLKDFDPLIFISYILNALGLPMYLNKSFATGLVSFFKSNSAFDDED